MSVNMGCVVTEIDEASYLIGRGYNIKPGIMAALRRFWGVPRFIHFNSFNLARSEGFPG
jgi:hypothetical protein